MPDSLAFAWGFASSSWKTEKPGSLFFLPYVAMISRWRNVVGVTVQNDQRGFDSCEKAGIST